MRGIYEGAWASLWDCHFADAFFPLLHYNNKVIPPPFAWIAHSLPRTLSREACAARSALMRRLEAHCRANLTQHISSKMSSECPGVGERSIYITTAKHSTAQQKRNVDAIVSLSRCLTRRRCCQTQRRWPYSLYIYRTSGKHSTKNVALENFSESLLATQKVLSTPTWLSLSIRCTEVAEEHALVCKDSKIHETHNRHSLISDS